MPFNFTIDPELPLPLNMQLRGLIEYGITCGELEPGRRLPSVRALAEQLGVAPMTVSQVYKDLQQAGLLEGRLGHGTFVGTDVRAPTPMSSGLEAVQRQIDGLIRDALATGFTRAELAQLFSARLNRVARATRPVHIALVGVFEGVTHDYAADLGKRLPAGDRLTATTIDTLRRDPATRARVASADLILAFANRKVEVSQVLRSDSPIMAISYIPSGRTRMALASLDPMKRIGLVSTFADFLPIMKSGVRRFAPQVGTIRATALGRADLPGLLAEVDVVIHSTGAEEVLAHLPAGTEAFEYRHVLNPREVTDNLLPMLERLRAMAPTPETEPRLVKEAP